MLTNPILVIISIKVENYLVAYYLFIHKFYVLVSYPVILLNSLIICNRFSVESLRLTILSSANNDRSALSPLLKLLLKFLV